MDIVVIMIIIGEIDGSTSGLEYRVPPILCLHSYSTYSSGTRVKRRVLPIQPQRVSLTYCFVSLA